MSTLANKTANTTLVTWAQGELASAAQYISAAQDVSTKFAAAFSILMGRLNGSAYTVGPKVRIEGSMASSGLPWVPLVQYQMSIGASIGSQTLNGALTAGGTTALMNTNVTNFNVGDIVFLPDSSTGNYELARIKSISSLTLTFEEAYNFNHANAGTVTTQGEMVFPAIDLSPYKFIRAVVDNTGTGQGVKVEVKMSTFNSVG